MMSFAMRNLKVFFKDKAAVFFSFLAVIIIVALYALFLGDVWISGMQDVPAASLLINAWIMAGLLPIASLTGAMGAFGTMVQDRADGLLKDFTTSPVKRGSLVGGYTVGAFVISLVIGAVTLLIAQLYMLSGGGEWIDIGDLLSAFGVLLLTTLSNTAMLLLFASLFKSNSAYSTASMIVGMMSGFVAGVYFPVGNMPPVMQIIVACFPFSHSAALLRQILCAAPMAASFEGSAAGAEFSRVMGITLYAGDTAITPMVSIIIIVGAALLFSGASILRFSRKSKNGL